MSKGTIGTKIGMTQVFDADGNVFAVSVIQVGPCVVVRKKSETGPDGYAALVLGFGNVRSSEKDGNVIIKAKAPHIGTFKKAGIDAKKVLRELRVRESDLKDYEIGQVIDATVFNAGERVDATGTSKGSGFTGVMKRHNFAGGKATHGVHEAYRHGGSIGMASTPGRVFKGTKMAGQDGNARVTIQNLIVHEVIAEDNLILVRGSIPGPPGGVILVRNAIKYSPN